MPAKVFTVKERIEEALLNEQMEFHRAQASMLRQLVHAELRAASLIEDRLLKRKKARMKKRFPKPRTVKRATVLIPLDSEPYRSIQDAQA